MKHTPAPWTTCKYSYDFGVYPENETRRGQDIALIRGESSEAEANAQLIAAAPEMHELLKECEQAFNWLHNQKYPSTDGESNTYKLAAKIGKLLQE